MKRHFDAAGLAAASLAFAICAGSLWVPELSIQKILWSAGFRTIVVIVVFALLPESAIESARKLLSFVAIALLLIGGDDAHLMSYVLVAGASGGYVIAQFLRKRRQT